MKQGNLINWIDINEFKISHKLMFAKGKINKIMETLLLILLGMWLILAIGYAVEDVSFRDIMVNKDDTAFIGIIFSVLLSIYVLYLLYKNLPLINVLATDQTIEYIEDTHHSYRRIRNRNNDVGLCYIWRGKLDVLLPMKYSNIEFCGKNLCIVTQKYKCALYDIELNKMITPVIFDTIEQDADGIIIATSNGVVSKYTQYGGRMF